jgi:hypothetical protein
MRTSQVQRRLTGQDGCYLYLSGDLLCDMPDVLYNLMVKLA